VQGGNSVTDSRYRRLKVKYDEDATVRAKMAGTQNQPFMGFPSKNRKMDIQVVDIHEFKDGKIVRTWPTEDWITGLRRLGVSESSPKPS